MKKKTAKKKEETKAPEKNAPKMKTIIVTGCSRGIGYTLIESLLEKNIPTQNIVMTCRDDEKGQNIYNEFCEKFPDLKERFFYHQLDITIEDSITELIGWIKKTFKKIDCLINNAGVSSMGTKFDMEVADFTFSVNVYGTISFTEKMIKDGCFNKQGKIICLSSLGGNLNKLKTENLQNLFKNAKTIDDLLKICDKFKESLTNNTIEEEGWFNNIYAISRMITNTFGRVLGHRRDVTKDQLGVYICDPGWVKTDQGGEHALLTPKEGIETILFLLNLPDGINKDNQGKLFRENKIVNFE